MDGRPTRGLRRAVALVTWLIASLWDWLVGMARYAPRYSGRILTMYPLKSRFSRDIGLTGYPMLLHPGRASKTIPRDPPALNPNPSSQYVRSLAMLTKIPATSGVLTIRLLLTTWTRWLGVSVPGETILGDQPAFPPRLALALATTTAAAATLRVLATRRFLIIAWALRRPRIGM